MKPEVPHIHYKGNTLTHAQATKNTCTLSNLHPFKSCSFPGNTGNVKRVNATVSCFSSVHTLLVVFFVYLELCILLFIGTSGNTVSMLKHIFPSTNLQRLAENF